MAAPKRQDTRKFFENLSGAGKSIAVLTSGGDAQGKPPWRGFRYRTALLLCGVFTYEFIKKNKLESHPAVGPGVGRRAVTA